MKLNLNSVFDHLGYAYVKICVCIYCMIVDDFISLGGVASKLVGSALHFREGTKGIEL